MSFWIIATLITLLGLAPIALAMLKARGLGNMDSSSADLQIDLYKQQLAEVDRDLARGVLSETDAERSKIEISRRLLDADKQRGARRSRAQKAPLWAAASVVILAAGGTALLYRDLGVFGYEDLPLDRRFALTEQAYDSRPSQAEIEAEIGPFVPQGDAEHIALVEKLRTAMQLRQDDIEGLELLVRNEASIGNAKGAYETQQKIIALKGESAETYDYEILADLMIQAGGGLVSPEAEQALQTVLRRDPGNGTAIYYSGLMFDQTGRQDLSFQFWEPLLRRSNPTDPWVPPIRAQIEKVAADAGIRYELPPLQAAEAGASALPGPSAEDMEAAAEMSDEDRMVMIRGMVDGLSERLASEGGSPAEWARLLSALGVLGEIDRAQAIWDEAQLAFGAQPDVLEVIRSGARNAGLVD